MQRDRVRMDLEDQVGHGVAGAQVPAPRRVILRAREIPDRAVRAAEHEGVGNRRAGADLEPGLEEHLGVQARDDDVADPQGLHEEIARRGAPVRGLDEQPGPVLVLLRDTHLPVCGRASASLRQRLLPPGQDLARLVGGRQVDVVERDGRLGRRDAHGGRSLDPLPGREQDVGDVAERPSLPGTRVRADAGGHLHDLPAELRADAVLRVAAVDLEPHPRARVDVAGAALEEQREPAEAPLDHLPGSAREVGRGDRGARPHRDRVARVAEDDRRAGRRRGRRCG